MKIPFILLFIAGTITPCSSQGINEYFEKIRNNNALLTAFFSQMPKGGDLHHHYSGSVYTETYIDYVVEHDYYMNQRTLEVSEKRLPGKGWIKFSVLERNGTLPGYRQKLFQKWSTKDYNGVDYPPDKLFFETFSHFAPASKPQLDKGLLEIKARAKRENVSYIETQFTSIPCEETTTELISFNTLLRDAQNRNDITRAIMLLDSLYNVITAKGVHACAQKFNDETVAKLHHSLGVDDATFTMRYQNYVVRILEPVEIFKNLIVACESADRSPLIVGVNIVAPEDHETSLKDYWLHMMMFKFCQSKYPTVQYAMHAGELTLGMVKPEDLTWHINAAVHTAGARRIGHGVAIAYEKDCYALLNYMRENDIPVEINLSSNEFILKVKEDRHPISLYKEFNVPIIICTDDAGVLRTNLTEQYVLLARRYKNITYTDIKGFVYNSLKYSFIEDGKLKADLLRDLDQRFADFEKIISLHHKL